MMIQIMILRCPQCRNLLDIESLYSGLCIICEFRLRTKDKQEYEFTLEVYYENY